MARLPRVDHAASPPGPAPAWRPAAARRAARSTCRTWLGCSVGSPRTARCSATATASPADLAPAEVDRLLRPRADGGVEHAPTLATLVGDGVEPDSLRAARSRPFNSHRARVDQGGRTPSAEALRAMGHARGRRRVRRRARGRRRDRAPSRSRRRRLDRRGASSSAARRRRGARGGKPPADAPSLALVDDGWEARSTTRVRASTSAPSAPVTLRQRERFAAVKPLVPGLGRRDDAPPAHRPGPTNTTTTARRRRSPIDSGDTAPKQSPPRCLTRLSRPFVRDIVRDELGCAARNDAALVSSFA